MSDVTKMRMALDCHLKPLGGENCTECAYECKNASWLRVQESLVRDVVEYLAAQEPRLMTWREVIGAVLGCKPVYIEVQDSEDKEPGDDRWVMLQQYKDNLTNGMLMAKSSYIESEVMFEQNYGKVWRCWDKEPTDEQRLAVKWE